MQCSDWVIAECAQQDLLGVWSKKKTNLPFQGKSTITLPLTFDQDPHLG
jgi:hypothetical protein